MKRVTAKMREGVASGVFPSAVLRIERHGEVLLDEAFGKANRDTIFDIASLTKPIVSAAFSLMEERGELSIDDPVSRWFSEFTSARKQDVTLRHLLSHCSGLPDWKPYFREILPDAAAATGESRRELVRRVAQEPLIYRPGGKGLYSDLGYILLGEVLERILSERLDRLLSRLILEPLKMGRTGFSPKSGEIAPAEICPWRGRELSGEVSDENAWVMGGVAGHAGLFSTTADYALFAHEVLAARKGEGRVLPHALLEYTKRMTTGIPSTWALGWDTPSRFVLPGSYTSCGSGFSIQSFGHLGFTGGSIWIDPSEEAGELIVLLFTNRVHPSRSNDAIREFRPQIHDLISEEIVARRGG